MDILENKNVCRFLFLWGNAGGWELLLIYWNDVALFCYPQEYQLSIFRMKNGDIIEIDNLSELISLFIARSKYGNIVLGEKDEKPKYSFFAWGSMMFTCGLAADILFYSFSDMGLHENFSFTLTIKPQKSWL